MIHVIEVRPARRPGRFEARHEGQLIAVSETPFLSGCRRLLVLGIADPNDVVIMKHGGSKVEALRSRVGVAAGLTIEEGCGRPRLRRFKGYQNAGRSAAHSFESAEAPLVPEPEDAPTGATVTVGGDP
jgi:hypothetical protein